MPQTLKVLIVGHSKEALESLKAVVRELNYVKSATRHLDNGHVDPLHGVGNLPDVLILQVSHNWEDELEALNVRSPALRPVVLVVGRSDDLSLLRRAMQVGVRDFLSFPVDPAEVTGALEKIREEKRFAQASTPAPRHITAVLNAKGGSGASLLASNIAHIMTEQLGLKTALVDLDLQLGTTALSLNLEPKVGLSEALAGAQDIDAVALVGYMTRHTSGLDVMTNISNPFIDLTPPSPGQLERLLTVVSENYDHVVLDVPRHIDAFTLKAISLASRILLVLQQHLSSLHDAKRLLNVLRGTQEGVDARSTVVINRFQKNSSISEQAIEEALGVDFHARIPNDYKRVSKAEDLGLPLLTHAPSAPITRALCSMATNLSGTVQVKRSFFKRLFAEQESNL